MTNEEVKNMSLRLKRIRQNTQTRIDDGEIRANVRFNGGNPVVLCYLCSRIIEYVDDPETAQAKICPEGEGCGETVENSGQLV